MALFLCGQWGYGGQPTKVLCTGCMGSPIPPQHGKEISARGTGAGGIMGGSLHLPPPACAMNLNQ